MGGTVYVYIQREGVIGGGLLDLLNRVGRAAGLTFVYSIIWPPLLEMQFLYLYKHDIFYFIPSTSKIRIETISKDIA